MQNIRSQAATSASVACRLTLVMLTRHGVLSACCAVSGYQRQTSMGHTRHLSSMGH
jgi:hypothetical protein